MTASDPHADLRSSLEELARPIGRELRARRGKDAVAASVPIAIRLVAIVPACDLLFRLLFAAVGVAWPLPLQAVIVTSLLAPVGLLFVAYLRASRSVVSDRSALMAIDDELELADRLSTAHEFLAAPVLTPFMEAAVEDTRARLEAARAVALSPREAASPWRARQLAWGLVAALCLVIASSISVSPTSSPTDGPAAGLRAAADEDERDPAGNERGERDREASRERNEPPAETQSTSRTEGESADVDSERKRSRGQIGRGKSAEARSVGGQSSGEGASSTQAQPTRGGSTKKPRKDAKESERKKREKAKKPTTPPDEKESVSSAGRGRGRGASRSPTASDWSSKDQIVTDEDEEFDEDEDVQDDEEESDARGGVQPNLRQRKPPVNRDLSIGFAGGKPPPFANGRGGAGLPKKQRGVAQLVLGVPFPDHITGQPGPGMTKVTQERIEPQSSAAPPAASGTRRPRSGRMGELVRTVTSPWMQDVIREFFDSRISNRTKE